MKDAATPAPTASTGPCPVGTHAAGNRRLRPTAPPGQTVLSRSTPAQVQGRRSGWHRRESGGARGRSSCFRRANNLSIGDQHQHRGFPVHNAPGYNVQNTYIAKFDYQSGCRRQEFAVRARQPAERLGRQQCLQSSSIPRSAARTQVSAGEQQRNARRGGPDA